MTAQAPVWWGWEAAEETLQVPVSAVGTTTGLNKLCNYPTPSALPLHMVFKHGPFPFCPPKELFLRSVLQSTSWCCHWRGWDGATCRPVFQGWGQVLSYMMGPSARAGWGKTCMTSAVWAVLLQVKKHLEIFHLWDGIGTGGEDGKEETWVRIAQPGTDGKEIRINLFCLTLLNLWADRSLYKSLKSG